jgi:hypothetical protein
MSYSVTRELQWVSVITGTLTLATSVGMAQTPQLEVCRREGPPGCSIEADGGLQVTNTSSNKTYRIAAYVVIVSPQCFSCCGDECCYAGGPCSTIFDGIANEEYVEVFPPPALGSVRLFGTALPQGCSPSDEPCTEQARCCDNYPNSKCRDGTYFCTLATGYVDVFAVKVGSGSWSEYDPPVRMAPSCFVDAVPDLPCPNPN